MARVCAWCKVEKPLDEFYSRGKGEKQNYCRVCFLAYIRGREHALKQEALEYLGGKCQHCGYDKHPAAMDFHHLRDKKYTWDDLKRRSREEIYKELDKCLLLCANCHRIEHAGQLTPLLHPEERIRWRRKPRHKRPDKLTLEAAVVTATSCTAVARAFGVYYTTVLRWMEHHGIATPSEWPLHRHRNIPSTGFAPVTLELETPCSIWLSYEGGETGHL